MKNTFKFLLFLSLPTLAYDPCDYIKTTHCKGGGGGGGSSKSIGASVPTNNSVLSSPSALSSMKGLGLEGIIFEGIGLSVVTGNGKIGAGFSGANSDDTFFGNTAKELTSDYEDRISSEDNIRYDYEKYTAASGINLYSSKDKFFKANIGIMGKFVRESSSIYPGVGASLNFGPLNAGYSYYRDEGIATGLDGSGNRETIDFNVHNYSIGLNLPLLSFDYTILDNDLDYKERVHIYSSALSYDAFVLTYGRRLEESMRREYDFEDKSFNINERKWSTFLGLQYRFNKHFSGGILSNYYLSKELSIVLTGFF